MAEARREEVSNFVRKVIGSQPIAPPVPLSDAEWQRLRELVRELRAARRESTDTARADGIAAALLGGSEQIAELQRRRRQLHDAKLQRVRDLVFETEDPAEIIRSSRGWIAKEDRTLTREAFKDVALPALAGMLTAAHKPMGHAATVGTALGMAAFVVAAGLGQRPEFVIYLGAGAAVGAAVVIALTVGRFSWAVAKATVAGEPPLVRTGCSLLLAGLVAYGGATFSLSTLKVRYDPMLAWCSLVAVAVVGLLLIGVEAARARHGGRGDEGGSIC